MQDEITKLKSELDRTTEELYKLKAQSQIWNNPFSIYNKAIILSAIDNLIKGGSGQAMQNMNLLFGFKEQMGFK